MAVMHILIAIVMLADASGPSSCSANTLSSMKAKLPVTPRTKNMMPLSPTSRMDASDTGRPRGRSSGCARNRWIRLPRFAATSDPYTSAT